MEVLLISILIGLIPAVIAQKKGRSFIGWWVYGALLFIVALPHALLLRPNLQAIDQQAAESGLRKCTYCAEFIRPDALVCKHCGREMMAATS